METSLGEQAFIGCDDTKEYSNRSVIQTTIDYCSGDVTNYRPFFIVLFAFCGPAIFKKVSNSLGCAFLVSSADFRLCLHKFCGEADRGRLAGQRGEFKTYRKSTAQLIDHTLPFAHCGRIFGSTSLILRLSKNTSKPLYYSCCKLHLPRMSARRKRG